jgi:uncharacterized membrane protein
MISIGLLVGLSTIIIAILILVLEKPLNLNKNFFIKLSFILFLIASVCDLLSYFSSMSIFGFIGSLNFFLTISFILLHSSKMLGNKKTAIFFIIAFIFGLASEAISVLIGLYYYNLPNFFFGLVPLATPISWIFIIYISYILANLFLFGFGGEEPKKTDNKWYLLGLLLLLSSISGFIAVNLDMILDPVSVAPQVALWIYYGGGPYFGVPISNYIGWFEVTVIAIFLFRLYEVFTPSSNDSKPEINNYTYLYIILLYIIYLLFNAVKAYKLGRIELILIGTTTMAPFILIGLLALLLNRKRGD